MIAAYGEDGRPPMPPTVLCALEFWSVGFAQKWRVNAYVVPASATGMRPFLSGCCGATEGL
jgi:hypothetical protein